MSKQGQVSDRAMHQVDRIASAVAEKVAGVLRGAHMTKLEGAVALHKAAELLRGPPSPRSAAVPVGVRALGLEASSEREPVRHRSGVAEEVPRADV